MPIKLTTKTLPWIIIAAAFILFLVLLVSRPSPVSKPTQEKVWPVHSQVVKLGRYQPTVTLYGHVETPNLANLKSAVEADVIKEPIREGYQVRKGQLLIQLDDRDVHLVLQQRQADVLNLQAKIAAEKTRYQADQTALAHEQQLVILSRKALQRNAAMAKKQHVSEAELDSSRRSLYQEELALNALQLAVDDHQNRLTQLTAQLQRAKALVSDAELDLQRSQIVAPFDGRVAELNVSIGDRVRPGDILIQVYDDSAMEIRAEIPQRYLNQVKRALRNQQVINAHIQDSDQSIEIKLDRLAAKVERGRSGVDGLFQVISANHYLPLGDTVSLVIALPAVDDVVSVPIQAMYGLNSVYLIKEDRLTNISVERVGTLQNGHGGNHVLIRSPELKAGDKVMTTQLPNAISGMKVSIVDEVDKR